MDWRTVNEMVIDWSLTSLNALIVTNWEDMDWIGIPYMVPFEELRYSPEGRDPSMIENDNWSPLIEGSIENETSLGMTWDDWG